MLPILIVDDSPEDRSFAERAFRLNRIRNPIILIGGGKRCLEYFKGEGEFEGRELPALVFIDLAMPDVSGVDVLKKVKKTLLGEQSIFVMLSGIADLKTVHKGYLNGAVTFFVKPFEHADLLLLLNNIKGIQTVKTKDGYELQLSKP